MAIKNNDLDVVLRSKKQDEIDAILNVKVPDEIDVILDGKIIDEQDLTLRGIASLQNNLSFSLRGTEHIQNDLDIILQGKIPDELDLILGTKSQDELGFILTTPPEILRRLTLLDKLKLRDTSVYRNPRDISILKIAYGDLSNVKIPCTALDESGTIYHASDRPMMSISKVYVEGEPKSYGYQAYTSYKDETGHSIACVVFDNPQYDKTVSISGKGAMKLDTGELIENPADLIEDILLNIQGYDRDSVDAGDLAKFYADCLREEIMVACILDSVITIKNFLDELARNIHARWLISDGKSVMRLRWL